MDIVSSSSTSSASSEEETSFPLVANKELPEKPVHRIRMFISCCNLRDLYYGAKSDPYCEVWYKDDVHSRWTLILTTETIKKTLNPQFKTPIEVDYCFEKNQEIQFRIFDEDQQKRACQAQHKTTIAKIVGAHDQNYIGILDNEHRGSKLVVMTESVVEPNLAIQMDVSCQGLKSKKKYLGLASTNHPYLVIKKCDHLEQKEDDYKKAQVVYSSEVVHGTLNPSWQVGELPIQDLCYSNLDVPIIFEIWSAQSKSKHRIYGRVKGTPRDFLEQEGNPIPIIKRQGNPYGKLIFDSFKLIHHPTIVDYLRGGWNISLSVAIDFTSSNGSLSDPNSLHHIDPAKPKKLSPYEKIITQ